jgi:hypothetical protein
MREPGGASPVMTPGRPADADYIRLAFSSNLSRLHVSPVNPAAFAGVFLIVGCTRHVWPELPEALRRGLARWPEIPDAIRAGILALFRAAGK